MYEVFADLHVHIGRSEKNKPIKITAARSLNFANIAKECRERKGIDIVGIIDCASPYIIEDIEDFLKTGEAYEIEDGGIIYKDKVCIILGSEIETSEKGLNGHCGSAHNICFFPHLDNIKGFSNEMSKHIKNITLSSQRADISAYELIDIVEKYNGILIPAHCFTPHKSFYGNCTDRLEYIFKEKYNKIPAIELGLSSDTFLADTISELENKTFITNSDAHSLPKIAREYNKMLVNDISFKELVKALKNENGRKIICNYGLDPKLGKYHRTYCEICGKNIPGNAPVTKCDTCDSKNITMGVFDRIETIKDKKVTKSPENRPEYIYQIPLNFIPGLGKKTIDKLLNTFETEMNILHKLSFDDLEAIIGEKIANNIILARERKNEDTRRRRRSIRKNRKHLKYLIKRREHMSDTITTVIAIFIAAILMFIFPLMAIASQNDEISQIAVQSIITDFTNTVAQQGKITSDEYDTFIQKLQSTGNSFDVELEAKILDENPSRKETILNKETPDKNVYYSEYTNTIENQLNSDTSTYRLKKGDYIIVSAKNTNTTIGTQLKNFLYNIIGKDTYTIGATVSTLVINTGILNYDTTVANAPTPEPTPEPAPTPELEKAALLNEILSYHGKFLEYNDFLQLGTKIHKYLNLIAETENPQYANIWILYNNVYGGSEPYNRAGWESCWKSWVAPQGSNCLYLVDISEYLTDWYRLWMTVRYVTYNEDLLDKDINFFNSNRANFITDETGSKDYRGYSPYKYVP